MAGTNSDFDAEAFRTGIRIAYAMAAPPVAEDQVVFHFASSLVYVGTLDEGGVPFDPDTSVRRVEPPSMQVPCAVEYLDAEDKPTAFGLVASSRVRITLLDEDYLKVKDAIFITISGDRYDYRRTQPPSGLFDVGLFTLHYTSVNET